MRGCVALVPDLCSAEEGSTVSPNGQSQDPRLHVTICVSCEIRYSLWCTDTGKRELC